RDTGQSWCRIERGPFEAAVEQAKAAKLRAQALLENATLQLQRAEELVKTSATSIAVRDERLASQKAAQGDLTAAEAALKTAEINLAYTDINSPIDGRIGRTAVTRGNVVGPDSGVLPPVVRPNPMYVTFPVSQREFIRIFPPGQDRQSAIDNSKVVVQFSNGPVYQPSGKSDLIDLKREQAPT